MCVWGIKKCFDLWNERGKILKTKQDVCAFVITNGTTGQQRWLDSIRCDRGVKFALLNESNCRINLSMLLSVSMYHYILERVEVARRIWLVKIFEDQVQGTDVCDVENISECDLFNYDLYFYLSIRIFYFGG